MDLKNMEMKVIGNVKIVWLPTIMPFARSNTDGRIVRGYIEFDDCLLKDGLYRTWHYDQVMSGFSKRKLYPGIPMRIPMWIGELVEITQDKVDANVF
jgi:hypothetical protein